MAVTLCPIAVIAGCRKCPVFSVCPLKSVIGDQVPASAADESAAKPRKPAKKSSK